jgi:hypothetical protein
MSRFAPGTLRSVNLRGRNKICRLSGRHDISILFAHDRSVNSLPMRRKGRIVHALVHTWQECVDA